MRFHKYAATETVNVVRRLLVQSAEQDRRDLARLREALGAATKALETTLARTPSAPDDEIGALIERLTKAAAEDTEAVKQQVLTEAQGKIDGLHAQIKQEKHRADTADAEVLQRREQIKQLEKAQRVAEVTWQGKQDAAARQIAAGAERVAALERIIAEQTSLHEELTDRLDVALASEETARQRAGDAEREAAQTRAEAEAAGAATAKAETSLAELAARVEELTNRLDAAVASEKAARQRAGNAERDAVQARAEAEAARVASTKAETSLAELAARTEEARKQHVHAVRQDTVTFASRTLGQLVTVFESFESCTTVIEALTHVATGLATEFSRVALFRVKDNRLDGIEQFGFDPVGGTSNLVVPLTLDSILTRAVSSRRSESFVAGDGAGTTGVPFGGTPAFALALPIVVAGEVIAVVYADDSNQPNAHVEAVDLRRRVAELLVQAAAPWLKQLAVTDAETAEWRDYAKLLMTELEHTYAAQLSTGTSDAKRRSHLKETIECARQLYAQRIGSNQAVAGVLEQHLMDMAKRPATPFARDVAAVLKAASVESGSASRSHAEAS